MQEEFEIHAEDKERPACMSMGSTGCVQDQSSQGKQAEGRRVWAPEGGHAGGDNQALQSPGGSVQRVSTMGDDGQAGWGMGSWFQPE